MEVRSFDPELIVIRACARAIDRARIDALCESIKAIGLRTPNTVRIIPQMNIDGIEEQDVPLLVTGRHRLEAVRSLGQNSIDAVVQYGSELDARMWEIAENLHRAELTVLERSEHIAEWIKLSEEQLQSAQVEPKLGRGRPEGGINAAARELGVDRNEAQRTDKIASLAPEAKKKLKS